MKKTILLAIVMVTFVNVSSQIKVDRLKCEYLTNPEGIDMPYNNKYSNDRCRNVYERIVINKEDLVLPWINPSDIEKDFIGK